MENATKPYKTLAAVAVLLGIHPRTARRYCDQGLIRCIRFGRTLRIPAEEFDRLAPVATTEAA